MKMSPSMTQVTRPSRPNLTGILISVLVAIASIVKTQALPLTNTRADPASALDKTEFDPHKVTPSFQASEPSYLKHYAYRIPSQAEKSKTVNEYPNVYGNYLKMIDPPQEVYRPNNVQNNLEDTKTSNEYNDQRFNYGYQQPQVIGVNEIKPEEVERHSVYQHPIEFNPSYRNAIQSPKRRRDIRTDQYRYDQIFANDFDDAYSGTEDRIYYYYYDPTVDMRFGPGSRQVRYENSDFTNNDNVVSQNGFNVREKSRSKSKFGKIRAPGERAREIFSDRKLPGDRSNSAVVEDVGRLPVQNQGQRQRILSPVRKSENIEERGIDRNVLEKITTQATVTDETSAQTTAKSRTSTEIRVESTTSTEPTVTSRKTSAEPTETIRTSVKTTMTSKTSTENGEESRTSTEPTVTTGKTSAETTEATRTSVKTTMTSKTSTENREESRTSSEPTEASSKTYVETTAPKITTAAITVENKTFTPNTTSQSIDVLSTSNNSATPTTRSNTSTETAEVVETPTKSAPTNETYAETTVMNNTPSGNSYETSANKGDSEIIISASKTTSTRAPKSSFKSKESNLHASATSDDELYMDVKNQVGDYLGLKPDISPYRNSVLDVELNKTSHARGKSGQNNDRENRTTVVSNNTTSVGKSLTEKENTSLSDVEKENKEKENKRSSESESENDKKLKISDKNDNEITETTKRISENVTSEMKTGQTLENTNVIRTDKENGLNTEIKKTDVPSEVDNDSKDVIDTNDLNVPQVVKNESQITSNVLSAHKTPNTRVNLQNQTSTESISLTENDQSVLSSENVTSSKTSDRSPSNVTIQTVQNSEADEDIKISDNSQVENTETKSKTTVEDNNHPETTVSNSSTIIESINDTITKETDVLEGDHIASNMHKPPTEIKILMKKDEQKKRTNEINSLASVRASEIPTIQFNSASDDRNSSKSGKKDIPKDVDIVQVENAPQTKTEINELDINVKDASNTTQLKVSQNEYNKTDLKISQNDDSVPSQESKTVDIVKPTVNMSHILDTHDVSKTIPIKSVSVAEINDVHTTTVPEDKIMSPTEQLALNTSLLQTPQEVPIDEDNKTQSKVNIIKQQESLDNVSHNADDRIAESNSDLKSDLDVTLDKQSSTTPARNTDNSTKTPLSSEGKAENISNILQINKETNKASNESLESSTSNNTIKSKTPTTRSETSPTIISTQESINSDVNNNQIQTDIRQENILEPKNQHFESTISIHEEITVDKNKTTKLLNNESLKHPVSTTPDSSVAISENIIISSNITSQNVSYQQTVSAQIETIPTRTANVKSSPKSSDVPTVNHANDPRPSSEDITTVNHANDPRPSSEDITTVNHANDPRPSSEDITKKSKSVSVQNDTLTLQQPTHSPKLQNRNVPRSQKKKSPPETHTNDSGIQAENKPVHQQRPIPRQTAHRLTLADFPSLLLRRQEISRNKIVMSSDIGGDKMAISSTLHNAKDDGVRDIKIPRTSAYMIQDFALRKPEDWQLKSREDPKGQDATNDGKTRDKCNDTTCRETPSDYSLPHGTTTTKAKAAVSAVLTTHFGPTKQEIVPFDLVLLDLADNYDNTTGMFIATIPGTYVISVYLMSHPGAKVNARVYVNDRPVAALWADDSKHAGFYPSSSIQTVAQLGFGDQVYVMLVDGGYGDSWVHANYNVFTIFLLYEETF